MGQHERETENKRQSRRDKAKDGRSRRAAATAKLELRQCNWVYIAALTTAFADEGGAVRWGYTRDAGALAVGCYLGDDYATEYIRPSEDFELAVQEIAEAWLENQGQNFHQALQVYARAPEG